MFQRSELADGLTFALAHRLRTSAIDSLSIVLPGLSDGITHKTRLGDLGRPGVVLDREELTHSSRFRAVRLLLRPADAQRRMVVDFLGLAKGDTSRLQDHQVREEGAIRLKSANQLSRPELPGI